MGCCCVPLRPTEFRACCGSVAPAALPPLRRTTEQRKAESERIRNNYADRIPVPWLCRPHACALRERSRLTRRRVLAQVICEKADRSDVPDIDKKKVGRALANCLSQEPQTVLTMRVRAEQFLVPHDLTVGQFMFVIRKRIKVPAEKGIFLFVQGTHPANGKEVTSASARHAFVLSVGGVVTVAVACRHAHVDPVRGVQGRGRLPVHDLQRRDDVRMTGFARVPPAAPCFVKIVRTVTCTPPQNLHPPCPYTLLPDCR